MPNSYFQFKQFRVEQDKCAMKVTTEGCILGAWVNVRDTGRVLDIGGGTGLLSLMLAQKSQAKIDTVEIDTKAFQQSQSNFQQSPWANRLSIHHGRIQDFKPNRKYDYIISNPPFFSNHLKAKSGQFNVAAHSEALSQDDLVEVTCRLLDQDGNATFIFPSYEADQFLKLALKNNLYLKSELVILNRAGDSPFRKIKTFGFQKVKNSSTHLIIREGNDYSRDFVSLLKDYYLHL